MNKEEFPLYSLVFSGKEQGFAQAKTVKPCSFFEKYTTELLTTDIVNNNHLFLRSDNLIALKTLLSLNATYDVIYIDPPYNSQSKFTYNDRHDSTSQWLSMLLPRLILGQEILSEHGLFFVSIDDRQFAPLTVLLREIFGEENHVGTIKWRKKRKPSHLSKHFASVIEYVLIFCKNKNSLKKLRGADAEESTRPVLNAGNQVSSRILKKGMQAFFFFFLYSDGLYKNKTLSLDFLSDFEVIHGHLANDVVVKGRFRVNQDVIDKTAYLTPKCGLRRHVLPEEKGQKHVTDDGTNLETNEDGELQLRKLFDGQRVFDFPKPVGLLEHLISLFNPEKNLISCLDFFAGSATLAHAVMELNLKAFKQKSNLLYRYCCIQNEEVIDSKVSHFKTIADIAEQRIKILEAKYELLPRCKVFLPKN